MTTCSLTLPVVVDGQKLCAMATCRRPLPKRRIRWCSNDCGLWYAKNHIWQMARDYRLVHVDEYVCQMCKELCVDWRNESRHPDYPTYDPKTPWSEWHPRLLEFRAKHLDLRPEVNHKNPRVGQGYSSGCWNHVDLLETLCHRDHVKVTRQQRAERRMEQAMTFARSRA